MTKQLASVLTTAAAAASLFIPAGTSHADVSSATSSFDQTVKTDDEPERPSRDASDTFVVETKGPIEAWMCNVNIGGDVDCFWVADPR